MQDCVSSTWSCNGSSPARLARLRDCLLGYCQQQSASRWRLVLAGISLWPLCPFCNSCSTFERARQECAIARHACPMPGLSRARLARRACLQALQLQALATVEIIKAVKCGLVAMPPRAHTRGITTLVSRTASLRHSRRPASVSQAEMA